MKSNAPIPVAPQYPRRRQEHALRASNTVDADEGVGFAGAGCAGGNVVAVGVGFSFGGRVHPASGKIGEVDLFVVDLEEGRSAGGWDGMSDVSVSLDSGKCEAVVERGTRVRTLSTSYSYVGVLCSLPART